MSGAIERFRSYVEADVPGTHQLERVEVVERPLVEQPRPAPAVTTTTPEIEREKTIRLVLLVLAVVLGAGLVISGLIVAAKPSAPSCFAFVCGDQTSGR